MAFEYSDTRLLPVVKKARGLERNRFTEILDLTNSNISDLSVLHNLPHLVELYLAENPLLSFSCDDKWRFHLKTLDISFCQIKQILTFTTPLRFLVNLNISHNHITSLECIQNLQFLQTLDASHNDLSEIGHLNGLSNLEDLQLNSNTIISITALSSLSRLRNINLSDNQIVDISSLTVLKSIQTLNLESNNIPDLSQLKSLPPSILTFLIRNNPCCELENYSNEIIYTLRSVRELNGEKITPEKLTKVCEKFGEYTKPFEMIKHYYESKCDSGRREFFVPSTENVWSAVAEAGFSTPWEKYIKQFIEIKPTSIHSDSSVLRALSDCIAYPIKTDIESIEIENKVEYSEHMGLGLKLLLGQMEKLTFLTELTLSGCGLGRGGEILPSPLRAPNLLKLNLSDNFLGTHVVQRDDEDVEFVVEACPLFQKFIMDVIEHQNLQELDISLNGLDCRAADSLVTLFEQPESPLRKLNISQNSLADSESQCAWKLMKLLGTNAWLTQLSIADVFVKENHRSCSERLWASMGENRNIRVLDVSGNMFSAKFFKSAFVDGHCALSTLIAQRCNFSLHEFLTISEVLTESPRHLDCVSLRDNRINTKLLNSILGAAAANLSKLEIDTPKFVNMEEDLSNFGNALASPGLHTLMLQGWVSFNGVTISPSFSSLGVTSVLNLSDLGLDAITMSQLISAIANSPTLEALMIGGNSFDFNTWDALHTACDIASLHNLRFLSLQGIQILTAEDLEIFGLILQSEVVEKHLTALILDDIEWLTKLDEHFWRCLPQRTPSEPGLKESFTLKMNRLNTLPDFQKFLNFLKFLQVSELHVDDSSFVLDAFEPLVECITQHDILTHLSMRTSAPISVSNEAVLMLVACHQLKALRLPAFLQDHILEDIFVLSEEHESLGLLETQYDALQKHMEGFEQFWNALRCSLAVRNLQYEKKIEFDDLNFHIKPEVLSSNPPTPITIASSDS